MTGERLFKILDRVLPKIKNSRSFRLRCACSVLEVLMCAIATNHVPEMSGLVVEWWQKKQQQGETK